MAPNEIKDAALALTLLGKLSALRDKLYAMGKGLAGLAAGCVLVAACACGALAPPAVFVWIIGFWMGWWP